MNTPQIGRISRLTSAPEAAYLRSDLFEQRRSLMDTWAAFATTTMAQVVPIRA